MEWIIHDSHQLVYRCPFGAVPTGEKIVLRLKVYSEEYVESVVLRLWKHDGPAEDWEMPVEREDGGIKVYGVQVQAPPKPGLMWYYFVVIRQGRVFYYGNNHQRLGGKGLIQEIVPPPYQITVYKKGLTVPAWFNKGVMYQIFVDRFYNGLENGRVLSPKKGCLIHADWEDTPIYIRDPMGGIKRWNFFGGNLLGIIKKLSYLKELGIKTIYLNPIFESPSNHKYDTGDYKKVDPMFGTNETFRTLCEEADKLGIKIILDGVFSHTGSDSIYFNANNSYPVVGACQSPDSPYYSWYRFIEYPHTYESWWGIGTLPNVNELDPSYQDFIFDAEDSVVKYWLKQGAKGWRLDVADELPDEFIKRLKEAMKSCDPEAVLIGEVWEDASNKVSYGVTREYLWGGALDSVMNYPFRAILLDFILGHRDAKQTAHRLMSLYENYPAPQFYNTMNLLGSHDVPRVLTILGEGPPDNHLNEEEKERTRLSPQQRKLAIARLKLLALVQMTFPGVPCVYYGDEAGMEGYGDPFNRGPYPWGREEKELLSWYKKIIALRNAYPVFQDGGWFPVWQEGDVFGYVRIKGTQKGIAVFNRSVKTGAVIRLELGAEYDGTWREPLLMNREIKVIGGKILLNLESLEGRVLVYP